MNAMTRSNEELGALAPFVDALQSRPVADSDTENAQSKLMQRLAAVKPRATSTRWGWLTAAGVAGLLTILVLPTLMIGPTPAFAEVLRHFRDFSSMRMLMTIEVNGGPPQHNIVTVNRDGDVRTDIGEIMSVIVNRKASQVLTLLHQPKVAQASSVDMSRSTPEDSLQWIDDLRAYQGAATLLPQTRTIDGQRANGHELQVEGRTMIVWANAEGLPLEMEMDEGELMNLSFRFEFDRPLDADAFSTVVPEGYTLSMGDD